MTTALRPLSALLLTGCSLTVTSESFPTPGADAGEPICLPSESTCDGRDDDCDG